MTIAFELINWLWFVTLVVVFFRSRPLLNGSLEHRRRGMVHLMWLATAFFFIFGARSALDPAQYNAGSPWLPFAFLGAGLLSLGAAVTGQWWLRSRGRDSTTAELTDQDGSA